MQSRSIALLTACGFVHPLHAFTCRCGTQCDTHLGHQVSHWWRKNKNAQAFAWPFPRMEPIGADPRYPALLERLGLVASEPISARP